MWGKLLALCCVISFLLIGVKLVPEADQAGPDIKVIPELGPFIQIWDDAGQNVNPAIAYNSQRDEYLVVWVTEQDEFSWDIWGRRLRSDGSQIPNGWFNIDNIAGVLLDDPAVAYNSLNDQYLVVYSAELTADDRDIWGKIINWNGVLSNRLPLDDRIQWQMDPAVVYNHQENQYLLAYSDWQSATSINIHLQTLDQDGGWLKDKMIVSGEGIYRYAPELAYNSADNHYLVVYTNEGAYTPKVLGKSFSASLVSLSPEVQYNDDGIVGLAPKIACRLDGCLVTWMTDMGNKIKARRIMWDASPIGPLGGFEISAPITDVIQAIPSVALFKPWGYLIVWDYLLSTSFDQRDIFAAIVKFGQDQPDGNRFPIDDRSNYQGKPALACDSKGSCFIVNSYNPQQYPAGDRELSGRLVFTYRSYIPLTMR
jgi:hypothetical protein